MPELGDLDGGKLSAPVDLAPCADDSGTRRGGRHMRGGRAAVRRVLYLAALSAVRHNPAMRAFRDRLAARGERAKEIRTAVARKLLVIADAVLRTADAGSWDWRWRAEDHRPIRRSNGPSALDLEHTLSDGWAGLCDHIGATSTGAPGLSGQAAMGELMAYFAAHAERLDCAPRLHTGRSIGSGMEEGAAKDLIGERMKQTGARWVVANADAMASRCGPTYSHHWDLDWASPNGMPESTGASPGSNVLDRPARPAILKCPERVGILHP